MDHPDPEVQKAIIRLDDALCMWERNTFRQSNSEDTILN